MSTDSSKRTPSVSVPWKAWVAVIFVVVTFYASQFIAGMVISLYPVLKHWTAHQANTWLDNSVGAQFTFILIAEALTVYAVYWFVRLYKQELSIIGLRKPRWSDVAYGLAAVPFYVVLYILTVGVAQSLVPHLNVDQAQEIGFNSVHGTLAMALTFVSLVVLPPITEEILVRGYLYSSLKKALPRWGAVLLTSGIFAIAHLPEGGAAGPLYIAALDTFVLSLVLIYLREKTGGLWASITLHALKNGVAFVALFVLQTR